MANIKKMYEAAVRAGFVRPNEVSLDDFTNAMHDEKERKSYFDYVDKRDKTFYGVNYATFDSQIRKAFPDLKAKMEADAQRKSTYPGDFSDSDSIRLKEGQADSLITDFAAKNNIIINGKVPQLTTSQTEQMLLTKIQADTTQIAHQLIDTTTAVKTHYSTSEIIEDITASGRHIVRVINVEPLWLCYVAVAISIVGFFTIRNRKKN